ncbi:MULTISPECIES: hypothetical protein [Bacteria]|jgi:hypothetical protein|uniref:hypothetical protein n=1 Tax=Bacteria TaxID=2 RepID=UPI00272DA2DA|nr:MULTISPECIES: hypothetical protein [Bacteria]
MTAQTATALASKRDGEGSANLVQKAFAWAICHPVAASATSLLAIGLASIVIACANPSEQAYAIAPVIIGIIAIATAVGGTVAFDAATNSISDMLRGACNTLLSLSATLIRTVSNADALTQPFDAIYPTVEPVVRGIHETVAIPVANIILAIFFLVGLCKAVTSAGRADTGIDLFQLVLVFVMYGFLITVINASYDLMVMMFNMARWLIVKTLAYGTGEGVMEVAGIPDDVSGEGWLLVALVVCVVVLLASAVCAVITYMAIGIRCVQIYVYTAFAALPLAFFVSESSRSMATGFLKRYVALLFSGALMALLYVMYGAIVGTFGMTSVTPDTFEHGIQFLGELVLSCTTIIIFAFAFWKTGAWSRDFVGV